MTKTYYYTSAVGSCKHIVSFCTGAKTHADGSPFYDVRICRTAIAAALFIRTLEAAGYTPQP